MTRDEAIRELGQTVLFIADRAIELEYELSPSIPDGHPLLDELVAVFPQTSIVELVDLMVDGILDQ